MAIFCAVLVLRPWLPGWLVALGYLYGIVVILNLAFHLACYLKNRFFWRVRNRLLGSFVFIGLIPLLVILGVVFLSAYLLLGQLAVTYMSAALSRIEGEVSGINVELLPGAILVIFTDGVTEAVNGADEEFGEERLLLALRECCMRSPEGIYSYVVERVRQWQGELKQHDDITLIVGKVE